MAIDGETYDTPPFEGSPTLTWTREIGRVLASVTDGGAKVIGFDVIFPSSIEQSEIRLATRRWAPAMKGFDRDFLIAPRQISDSGKLVLGDILSNDRPDVPYRAQQVAVRNNIRALNVHTRPRRRDPADAAELFHRRQAGPRHGRRARCARVRHETQHRAVRCDGCPAIPSRVRWPTR